MSKKDNIASQALLEMDGIVSAIKEESSNTLKGLLAEAVKDALRESCNEDDDKEDYEVEEPKEEKKTDDKEKKSDEKKDSDTNEAAEEDLQAAPAPEAQPEQAPQATPEGQPAEEEPAPEGQPADGEPASEGQPQEMGGEEGWNDFQQYQVGDNTYDLTGEQDYDNVVKVYKLLKPEDNVVVKRDGDTLQLQDMANDTEYVIDLGGEEEQQEMPTDSEESEEMPAQEINEIRDLDDDKPEDEEIAGFADDNKEEYNPEVDTIDDKDIYYESKKSRKAMRESKKNQEVLFEVDLGYTDNYQDKDVISGLSNEEPSSHGTSWHKGVPTGTKKPWAGPSEKEGKPFDGKVDECGDFNGEVLDETPEEDNLDALAGTMEENVTTVKNQKRKKVKTMSNNNVDQTDKPHVSKEISVAGEFKGGQLDENKELKKTIAALRKNLNEAYITNVNLGKITKLFLENTTSRKEKVEIVNRFADEAKTVEASKKLYESISKELKSKNSKTVSLNESSVTAKGTKALNEDKIYKSDDLLKTIDLMNRINNL